MTTTLDCVEMEAVDVDIIKDKPWALQLLKTGENQFKNIFLNGIRIIQDITSDQGDCKKQFEAFFQCIEHKMNEVMSTLDTLYEYHLNKIAPLMNKITVLENELEITDSILTEQEIEKKSLVELEKTLKMEVERYQTMLDERNDFLKELHKKHAFYTDKLGKSPKRLSIIHSKTSIEQFKSKIGQLESEFTSRQERFKAIKKKIEEIYNETKMVPQEIWSELCDDSIKVSDEIMLKIENCYKETLLARANLYEKIEKLQKELQKLWILLEVPLTEQHQFLDALEGYSRTSLQKTKSEIKRLTEIRETKLTEIIEKQRIQIQELWDRCHCDSSTRHSFPFIYSNEYTEQLYNEFDKEINKWSEYYEQHSEILRQLEDYKKLQNSLAEINLNMQGVKFYENRGGSLRSTIKKKNIITSRIASAEKKLLTLSQAYFKNNKKHFLTHGLTIEDFLRKEKKTQGFSQNLQQDEGKLTIPSTKSQSFMKTPQRQFKKYPLKHPSSAGSSRPKTKTPSLPKFKLNQSKSNNSPSKSEWKPSKVAESKISDEEDSWTDYSDFEKDVKKYTARSTSFSKDVRTVKK